MTSYFMRSTVNDIEKKILRYKLHDKFLSEI